MASEHTSVNPGRLGRPDVEVWTSRYTCRLGVGGQAEDEDRAQKPNMVR
jgi:hypothetical protein